MNLLSAYNHFGVERPELMMQTQTKQVYKVYRKDQAYIFKAATRHSVPNIESEITFLKQNEDLDTIVNLYDIYENEEIMAELIELAQGKDLWCTTPTQKQIQEILQTYQELFQRGYLSLDTKKDHIKVGESVRIFDFDFYTKFDDELGAAEKNKQETELQKLHYVLGINEPLSRAYTE